MKSITGNGNFLGSSDIRPIQISKTLTVSAAVFAAIGIIHSSMTSCSERINYSSISARCAMRPFVRILWPICLYYDCHQSTLQEETNPLLVSGRGTRRAVRRYHRIPDLLPFPAHRHDQVRSVIQHSANSVNQVTLRPTRLVLYWVTVKPRAHQQQCRSNVRLWPMNRSIYSIRQCCFDIVAGVNGASADILSRSETSHSGHHSVRRYKRWYKMSKSGSFGLLMSLAVTGISTNR